MYCRSILLFQFLRSLPICLAYAIPISDSISPLPVNEDLPARAASAGIEWGKVASEKNHGNEWKRGSEWGKLPPHDGSNGNERKRGQDWISVTGSDGGDEWKRSANPPHINRRSPDHDWASPPLKLAPRAAPSATTRRSNVAKRGAEAEANRDDKPYRHRRDGNAEWSGAGQGGYA